MPEPDIPMTWKQLVRWYWPEATSEDCRHVLAEHISITASPAEMKEQLHEYMTTIGHGKQRPPEPR